MRSTCSIKNSNNKDLTHMFICVFFVCVSTWSTTMIRLTCLFPSCMCSTCSITIQPQGFVSLLFLVCVFYVQQKHSNHNDSSHMFVCVLHVYLCFLYVLYMFNKNSITMIRLTCLCSFRMCSTCSIKIKPLRFDSHVYFLLVCALHVQ